MNVFLTGANGWLGSAIARDLILAGHSVKGLVRTKENGQALIESGVTPLLGALSDLELLRQGATLADGVIHTAFGLDFANYAKLSEEDRTAIETFGEVFAGSMRPIIVTSGLGALPAGTTFSEEARPPINPDYPRASEQTAFELATRGLHISVIRPARSVHGLGERHGFVPMLANLAREKRLSVYVGDGQNMWPAVHRLDAARVYRLALERGAANEAFHAVAEGVPFRRVAEAIGRQMGVPTKSLAPEEAMAHFGALAVWIMGRGQVSSQKTRTQLEWTPQEIDLISDIDRPAYFS